MINSGEHNSGQELDDFYHAYLVWGSTSGLAFDSHPMHSYGTLWIILKWIQTIELTTKSQFDKIHMYNKKFIIFIYKSIKGYKKSVSSSLPLVLEKPKLPSSFRNFEFLELSNITMTSFKIFSICLALIVLNYSSVQAAVIPVIIDLKHIFYKI